MPVELVGVGVEARGFASDEELEGLVAAVEEAGEAVDERLLFERAAQLEACPAGFEEQPVRAVAELDDAAAEDPPDRQVERHRARQAGGEAVGGEQAELGCVEVAGGGERELVAAHPLMAAERQQQPDGGDDDGGGERDGGGEERGE